MEITPASGIEVDGIVSAVSEHPLVRIVCNGFEFQMEVDEARLFAGDVIEEATNAAVEAALLRFLKEEMEFSVESRAAFIGTLRVWRSDRWGLPGIPE